MSNLIKNLSELHKFRDSRLKFIVSSRTITPDIGIMDYLKIQYLFIKPEQIKFVFGTVTIESKLYGGRIYNKYHSLTEKHVHELYDNNIGISLNLTNHFSDDETYKANIPLLEKFYSPKNSIIITNDELAKRIKKDFPDYILKASIIKNITTINRLEKALELYDYITLPMELNDNDAFLNSIPQKDKIILFANARCAYTCPARTCYYGISQQNRGEKATSFCSKSKIPRLEAGTVYFDVQKLANMGFFNFKLLPLLENADNIIKRISLEKQKKISLNKKPDAFFISYPKCGRTWIRFILANYLNLLYKLGWDIDLYNFFHLLPNDTNDEEKGLNGFKYYNNDKIPLILFTHRKDREIDLNSKIIFLIRSPYDAMVSDYFQQTERLDKYKGNIKTFIRDKKRGINSFCDFLNGWSLKLDKTKPFILSYEELSENTYTSMKKLLQYLNIEINKELLLHSIKKSDFKAMQHIEKEEGMPAESYNKKNTNALRMREGKINNYKKYLDTEDINYINSTLKNELNTNILKILSGHNCL